MPDSRCSRLKRGCRSVCGDLYLETSWCIGEDIRWMISTIGPDRVMLGDLPSNVPVEIAKYKALDLEPEIYDKVMGGTAIEVFKLFSRGGHVRAAR